MKLTQRDHDRLDQIHEDLARVVNRAAEITTQPFTVTEGLRTLSRQKELYAKGRTEPGKIVTWTMNSQHLSGRAVDLGAIPAWGSTAVTWDEHLYLPIVKAVKQAAAELHVPITCGADWVKGRDLPHVELRKLNIGEK